MLFFLSVPHNPCWSVVVLCVKLVTYSPLKTMKSLMTNVKKRKDIHTFINQECINKN